jgi:formamidopyrimidine-DNA glycosylase
MPELPEVETVVRQLAGVLPKQSCCSSTIVDKKIEPFSGLVLRGACVSEVFRLGKQIVISFLPRVRRKEKVFLVVHLRMTGRLLWLPKRSGGESKVSSTRIFVNEMRLSETQHLRAKLSFEQGDLLFLDVRRFGTFRLVWDLGCVSPKGIDPLALDFTVWTFREMLRLSRQEIKQFLLRQDKIVGLGNIYACEALFRAKISPQRMACSLVERESLLLHRAIINLLKQAIKNCGTTFSDFQNSDGAKGGFQKFLQVYQRDGQPCRRCKSEILRIVQQGRGTFYCPRCQL